MAWAHVSVRVHIGATYAFSLTPAQKVSRNTMTKKNIKNTYKRTLEGGFCPLNPSQNCKQMLSTLEGCFGSLRLTPAEILTTF